MKNFCCFNLISGLKVGFSVVGFNWAPEILDTSKNISYRGIVKFRAVTTETSLKKNEEISGLELVTFGEEAADESLKKTMA